MKNTFRSAIKSLLRGVLGPFRDDIRRARLRLRSWSLPYPTDGIGRFLRKDRMVNARVKLSPGSRVILEGNVFFKSDLGERGHTLITIGENATLQVLGDFHIGPNVHISVAKDGILILGGAKASSASGITSSAKILVRKHVEIGADSIIAWDVFITDCDWHTIIGKAHTKPTIIGERVWIAHGASVLKGSEIADGCIVAAHAVCSMKTYPRCSLLAGVPAKAVQRDVVWSRELQ